MSTNAAVDYILLATVTHPLLVDHQTAVPHPPVSQELGDNLHLQTNNLMSTCWLNYGSNAAKIVNWDSG